MDEEERKKFEAFKKEEAKKEKLIKLKDEKSKLFKQIDVINDEIEKIQPKRARTYGDPVVEMY